ncbi:cytochrome P450 [Trichoderma afarasin]
MGSSDWGISLDLCDMGVCVYRLTLHPLAKYPGPTLAKLTNFYAAYHAFRGDLHLDMWKSHQKYGTFVRYGPNRILVNSERGLHDIYGYRKNIQKSKGYLPILPAPGAWSVHTAIDKGMHGHKRRVISQGLSDECIKSFEATYLVHLRRFMNKILGENTVVDSEGWTEAINMTPICNHFTFDVMGEFGFGKAFGMLDKPDNHFIIHAIAASNMRTSIYCQFPALSKLKLEKILYPRGSAMRKKFLDLTREFAEQRVSGGKESKNDLFRFVVDAKDPETGQGFSMAELWAESKFLIVAGSDTSSTVLATLFFYLTRYREVEQKLFEELRTTFSSLEEICLGPKLLSCTYLRACVDEAMRMNPPAGGAMWREVDSNGAFIDGDFVSPGFDVGTSMYAIHHNEEYYPESYTYKPERWIESDNNPAKAVQTARNCLNPFSLGPRGCIGRSLALMEIRVALARVVWAFEMKKPEGALGRVGEGIPEATNGRHRVNEFQLVDHLTSDKDGPYIQFKKRHI